MLAEIAGGKNAFLGRIRALDHSSPLGAPVRFRHGSWGARCNPPTEHSFKPNDNLRSTNRTSGTFAAPKRSEGLISTLQEQVRKAGHTSSTGRTVTSPSSFPGQMRSSAGPRPIRCVPSQAGWHRIQADVGDRRHRCNSSSPPKQTGFGTDAPSSGLGH
jgi:hypothetical protein